jgi:predicted Ser/Thr protein kinase
MNPPPLCPGCGKPLATDAPQGLCPECLLKAGLPSGTVPAPGDPAKPAAFVPPTPEELGRYFPQLEILELLGRGGMGAVYKARQKQLDRLVALKILPPDVGRDPAFAGRFEQEARAMAQLNHPHIVVLYEFGHADGLFYFLMEYVDGVNLRQLLQAERLSPREAMAIVPQICDALQYAHDHGIVHRDIKPENVLIDRRGRVRIADFGLAKLLGKEPAGDRLTHAVQVMGTPPYMAPEQYAQPLDVDHRADIYALGVVFYEMLTGELPVGKFSLPSKKFRLDVRLDEIVLHALEKEPERRYQQASQVKTDVETIVNGPAVAAAPPLPPPPLGPGAAPAAPAGGSLPPAEAEAYAREILARDYQLNISHCLDRGWTLLLSDFWPIVGVSALISALLWLCGLGKFGALDILLYGPLMGGLVIYYLRRIRGQPVTIEVAFAGFSALFLQLFLAGVVRWLLTFAGFICLILPGLYLWVAWKFTIALVADRRLDFWSAMELSRKVVSRHWWKLFWFMLVLFFLNILGLLFFFVGHFIALPVTMAAFLYAYEDLFGPASSATRPLPSVPLAAPPVNVPTPSANAPAPASAASDVSAPMAAMAPPLPTLVAPPAPRPNRFWIVLTVVVAVGAVGFSALCVFIMANVLINQVQLRRIQESRQGSAISLPGPAAMWMQGPATISPEAGITYAAGDGRTVTIRGRAPFGTKIAFTIGSQASWTCYPPVNEAFTITLEHWGNKFYCSVHASQSVGPILTMRGLEKIGGVHFDQGEIVFETGRFDTDPDNRSITVGEFRPYNGPSLPITVQLVPFSWPNPAPPAPLSPSAPAAVVPPASVSPIPPASVSPIPPALSASPTPPAAPAPSTPAVAPSAPVPSNPPGANASN